MECVARDCARGDIKARGLCVTHYNQWWYHRNHERQLAYARANKKRYRDAGKELVRIFKEGGCLRCGFNEHPAAIDCHHKNGTGSKDRDKHKGSNRSMAWLIHNKPAQVAAELLLCEPLCANCHRIEHHRVEAESDQQRFPKP